MNLRNASVAGLLLAMASMVTLVFRESLLAAGVLAVAVQVVAVLLMIWARLTFGKRSFHATANPTEGGVVTSGPYRFIRHPIYAAVIYFVWAGAVSHASILNLSLALLTTAGLALRMVAEERLVAKRYPEYTAYAAQTRRIIPYIL